jgi:uncharacterized repeat protein (TIGR03803 family)
MTKLGAGRTAGAVFLLCAATTIASAQTFTSLAVFDGGNGARPQYMSLVQGPDGTFYGTSTFGGNGKCAPTYGCGVVFKVANTGDLRALHKLEFNEGIWPFAGLLLATDGNLYGTTTDGGLYDGGAIFKITPGGTLTTIYSFCAGGVPCTDGAAPYGGLVEGHNGVFYGTTAWGGTNTGCYRNCGTVFKITTSGKLTTLANFCVETKCTDFNTDSADSYGALVFGTDGNLYGTSYYGGSGNGCSYGSHTNCGTVFRMTPGGTLTTLHNFGGPDGGNPAAGLVLGSDGSFYGTTSAFGPNGGGTVFKISTEGALTTLYNFCEPLGCANGGGPLGTLVQGTDGNFYGTTAGGGDEGTCNQYGICGTIFEITPNGTPTILFQQFGGTNGSFPYGGLLLATNGILYGTTNSDGDVSLCVVGSIQGCGTVFALDVGLRPFVSLLRNPARAGEGFGILGQGFTGTTSVLLNGTPANFTVVSETFIKATVPAGATTGYVSVTTPSSVLTSNVPFHVLP